MPIDDNFYQTLKAAEKHVDHYVWGPGKEGEVTKNQEVVEAHEKSGITLEPRGIHGTYVAVDFDDCVADGACLPVCPVAVFEWEKNPGKAGQDDRLDYTDKSDPIREADCIFCMACVSVCPTTAIKIDQSLVDVHNRVQLD